MFLNWLGGLINYLRVSSMTTRKSAALNPKLILSSALLYFL
jgi:hypothetical protein